MSANSTSEEPPIPSNFTSMTTLTAIFSTEATVIEKPPQLRFVFVPLTVLVLLFILSAMVFVFIRKKRVDRLRHHLMPLYNFEAGEDEGDWEAELLEDSADHHRGYKSMDYPRHHGSQELFGGNSR